MTSKKGREYGEYPRPPKRDEVAAQMDLHRPYTVDDIYRLFTEGDEFGYDCSLKTVRTRLTTLAEEGRIVQVKHRNGRQTFIRFPDGVDPDWV